MTKKEYDDKIAELNKERKELTRQSAEINSKILELDKEKEKMLNELFASVTGIHLGVATTLKLYCNSEYVRDEEFVADKFLSGDLFDIEGEDKGRYFMIEGRKISRSGNGHISCFKSRISFFSSDIKDMKQGYDIIYTL